MNENKAVSFEPRAVPHFYQILHANKKNQRRSARRANINLSPFFFTRVTDFADKDELFVVSAELQTDVKHLLNWKRVFKRIKRKISHNSVKLCREEEILLVNNCNHCLQK